MNLNWQIKVLFLGPLVPLFWTSGDVSYGFQSQSGQSYSYLAGVCVTHYPRFTSGVTSADLSAASMAHALPTELLMSYMTICEQQIFVDLSWFIYMYIWTYLGCRWICTSPMSNLPGVTTFCLPWLVATTTDRIVGSLALWLPDIWGLIGTIWRKLWCLSTSNDGFNATGPIE